MNVSVVLHWFAGEPEVHAREEEAGLEVRIDPRLSAIQVRRACDLLDSWGDAVWAEWQRVVGLS